MSIQGERIRAARERNKMSQEELAKELGSSQTQVTRWETGKRQPSANMLKKIADLLNTNSSYLNAEIDYEGRLTEQAELLLFAFDNDPKLLDKMLLDKGRQIAKKKRNISRRGPGAK